MREPASNVRRIEVAEISSQLNQPELPPVPSSLAQGDQTSAGGRGSRKHMTRAERKMAAVRVSIFLIVTEKNLFSFHKIHHVDLFPMFFFSNYVALQQIQLLQAMITLRALDHILCHKIHENTSSNECKKKILLIFLSKKCILIKREVQNCVFALQLTKLIKRFQRMYTFFYIKFRAYGELW